MRPNDPTGLAVFLSRVARRMPDVQIETGDRIGAAWRTATFPWPARVLAVLAPPAADCVPPLLALASEARVPLHPVSRGRSWGLGSRLPPQDAVALDLSRLDRILDLDPVYGTVRVEPGVTFAALQARVEEDRIAWHLPSFGGPADGSVLANALERGEGTGAFGDRYAHLWDLDVALATGERISTGHGRQGFGAAAAHHARPAGPLVEGLFTQAGLGVVLGGRLALQPTLTEGAMLLGSIGADNGLGPALSRLRRLVVTGVVAPHALAVWDGAKRRAAISGRYLGTVDAPGRGAGDWAFSIALSTAHPDLFRVAAAIVEAELRPVVGALTSVRRDPDDPRRLPAPLRGISDGRNVMSAYAGVPSPPVTPGNPDLDGCGFLWLCPVLPFDGGAVGILADLVGRATADVPLAPAIGMQAVSSRSLHGYVSLAWDRADETAEAAAMSAHDTLVAAFRAHGFGPYRLAHPTASAVTPDDDWGRVRDRLRSALDPVGILSPGRLAGGPRTEG